jgi:hypothetical protein
MLSFSSGIAVPSIPQVLFFALCAARADLSDRSILQCHNQIPCTFLGCPSAFSKGKPNTNTVQYIITIVFLCSLIPSLLYVQGKCVRVLGQWSGCIEFRHGLVMTYGDVVQVPCHVTHCCEYPCTCRQYSKCKFTLLPLLHRYESCTGGTRTSSVGMCCLSLLAVACQVFQAPSGNVLWGRLQRVDSSPGRVSNADGGLTGRRSSSGPTRDGVKLVERRGRKEESKFSRRTD